MRAARVLRGSARRNLGRFLHQNDFPSAVIAAVGAGLVRHFLLVAVGALSERIHLQEVMGPAAIPPRLGMSSFGIWHKIQLSSEKSLSGRIRTALHRSLLEHEFRTDPASRPMPN
jgi:hypothetical protein